MPGWKTHLAPRRERIRRTATDPGGDGAKERIAEVVAETKERQVEVLAETKEQIADALAEVKEQFMELRGLSLDELA